MHHWVVHHPNGGMYKPRKRSSRGAHYTGERACACVKTCLRASVRTHTATFGDRACVRVFGRLCESVRRQASTLRKVSTQKEQASRLSCPPSHRRSDGASSSSSTCSIRNSKPLASGWRPRRRSGGGHACPCCCRRRCARPALPGPVKGGQQVVLQGRAGGLGEGGEGAGRRADMMSGSARKTPSIIMFI